MLARLEPEHGAAGERGRAVGSDEDHAGESFRVRWREQDPGTWLYHCHVESHMAAGMIGTYRVSR